MSCAVAAENIDYLRDASLISNSEKIGGQVKDRLTEMADQTSLIGEVRGKGLMIGVELVKDRKDKTPASDEAAQLAKQFMKKGVLVGTGGVLGNVIRFQPPLCITNEQATKVLKIFEEEVKKF